MKLISIEDQIIKATIQVLLDAGYALSVNDGEETTLYRSVTPLLIFKAMKTTDEDYLVVFRGAERAGWVRFIYGNDGVEVINDFTINLDPQMDKITEMIDAYEAN